MPRHTVFCEKLKKLKDGNCTCYDSFEQFLQNEFMSAGFGGDHLTKDNFEDLFSNWVTDLDPSDLMEYGEAYGKYLIVLVTSE